MSWMYCTKQFIAKILTLTIGNFEKVCEYNVDFFVYSEHAKSQWRKNKVGVWNSHAFNEVWNILVLLYILMRWIFIGMWNHTHCMAELHTCFSWSVKELLVVIWRHNECFRLTKLGGVCFLSSFLMKKLWIMIKELVSIG